MSWPDYKNLMALANLLLCTSIGWICICRITKMTASTTRKATRLSYAGIFGAAFISGWSPWLLGDWAGWADISLASALLAHLLSSIHAWRNGLPDFAKSRPASLGPTTAGAFDSRPHHHA